MAPEKVSGQFKQWILVLDDLNGGCGSAGSRRIGPPALWNVHPWGEMQSRRAQGPVQELMWPISETGTCSVAENGLRQDSTPDL